MSESMPMPDASQASAHLPSHTASLLATPQAKGKGAEDDYSDLAEMGYCNSCGEEMEEGDECCDDGEWVPYEAEGER